MLSVVQMTKLLIKVMVKVKGQVKVKKIIPQGSKIYETYDQGPPRPSQKPKTKKDKIVWNS